MDIPHTSLPKDTLRGVLEEFVTREGTDWGAGTPGDQDAELERKVAAVLRQLERGEAVITWDPETETVSLRAPHLPDLPPPEPGSANGPRRAFRDEGPVDPDWGDDVVDPDYGEPA